MKKFKWTFPVFYILTFVVTILLAVLQEKLKISYDNITLPQLAPSIAVLLASLIYTSSKIALNFKFDKLLYSKYLIAFILPILVFTIGFYLCKILGLKIILTENLLHTLTLSLIGMFIGAIGEEIGWRGFLQPNLEKKYLVQLSSIITGLMWGCWHIGHYKNGLLFMLGFLLFTISASVILRKILENTSNNLLIPILFHFSINIAFIIFFKNSLTNPKMILTNGVVWATIAVVASFNKRKNINNK